MVKPIRTFTVTPSLPPELEQQRALVYNLRWAWNHDAIELFRWDRDLWEQSGHNPALMLGTIDQGTLQAAASDEGFLAHLNRVSNDFDAYLKSESTWFRKHHDGTNNLLVAYFSAEFGVTDCLSIFAGGLGILAGDHLKSASDLGVPLVAVGLLYQQGYLRQYLNEAGWQQEEYRDNDFHNLPLTLERDRDGVPLVIDVEYPGRKVAAQIWRAKVGRVALYLLDTNIKQNGAPDQDITDQLYGGDAEMRLKQEMMLGVGGCRALEAFGIQPSVYHLNEGHSAFLALERIRRLMELNHLSFAEAREAASAGLIFTTHTPVAAGHDYFQPDLMGRYFGEYAKGLGLQFRDFLALGRKNPNDDAEPFCMTALALRLAQSSNGVSRLHGQVTRRMWRPLWPGVPEEEIPIGHVTNGVHFQSWISQEMDEIYDRYLGPRWREEPADQSLWARAFARRRLREQLERRGAPQSEIEAVDETLDPDALTIGFARRFATYKRANLLLRDPERLARILNDAGRPAQIIFAGEAHPRDDAGKELIKQIVALSRRPEFRRRLVFLEGYDMAVARSMTQGADVWLSTPRRPLEASGTSGMKAAANGALNLSTLDGWWDEAWNCGLRPQVVDDCGFEQNWLSTPSLNYAFNQSAIIHNLGPQSAIGWTIGRGEIYDDPDYQDQVEAEALYDLLEDDVIPTFYDRGEDKLPRHWIDRMKASIGNLCHYFNTHRMVREYTERFYLPAAERQGRLAADGMARARSLAAWKERVRDQWSRVRIESATAGSLDGVQVNSEIKAQAEVSLGALTPDDVSVELYVGLVNAGGEIVGARAIPMRPVGDDGDGRYRFEVSSVACCRSGLHGFTVRALPRHSELSASHLPGLIVWAQADAPLVADSTSHQR
jgi:starch phosphorylase